MKRVTQDEYKLMVRMGWINFSESGRNVAMCGKQKPSRAKTYFVEDQMADDLKKYLCEQK